MCIFAFTSCEKTHMQILFLFTGILLDLIKLSKCFYNFFFFFWTLVHVYVTELCGSLKPKHRPF